MERELHGDWRAHSLVSEQRPRMASQRRRSRAGVGGWWVGVHFQGLVAALYRLRGQRAEEAGLSSGGGDMERRDLESPPELLCAGWWKREIFGPASKYGERQ